MRLRHLPPSVFVLSWLAYLAFWAFSAAQLPARVATHFDLAGRPNGWMTRTGSLALSAALGLGVPLVITSVSYIIRFVPNNQINLPGPRREYWLGPEQRAATMAYIFRHCCWLASMTAWLMTGVDYLTVGANCQGVVPHVSAPAAIGLLACFLVAFAAWFVAMFRHFGYFR